MPEYEKLRSSIQSLEALRADLARRLEAHEGDERTLSDLHQRVSKALKALSAQG